MKKRHLVALLCALGTTLLTNAYAADSTISTACQQTSAPIYDNNLQILSLPCFVNNQDGQTYTAVLQLKPSTSGFEFKLLHVEPTAPATGSTPLPADLPLLYGDLFVQTELYFGLSIPTGGTVSEEQWSQFVNEYVTPAFPDGLTMINGNGQYLMSNGEIAHEGSKVLILLHQNSAENSAKIEAIRTKYKALFAQESVMRVTTLTGVSF
ncbi:Protein of unknown function (DUF3574) [Beggiatoa alba B18LD]|uniref:DUF3574 domain-containing protein n=1 Tax=Beggiatoa alba B18LD TaxID=395493 RepID=I3CBX5_9GAMM|nr:DUF3574 domain-containing protein [Beggiatoa alba]EIJ41118.1 Protein of unknown function (DUF3574) [Beggiatoa alba B18LD]